MNGVLLLDKPSGPTSHDMVARARRFLRERRCGHTGTLDPFATGLLIVCVGRATRLARFLSDAFKSYEATVRFGYATDTYDRTGTPIGEPREEAPERGALIHALSGFEGKQLQRPPAFSAKRSGGKRLYELAREGRPIEARPVEVEFRSLELIELDGALARLRATVSSGTYLRSLAHDLGEALGVGAHLKELRRTAIGSFHVADAVDMSAYCESDEVPLVSPGDALCDLPSVEVGYDAARRLINGQSPHWRDVNTEIDPATAPNPIRVVDPSGELVAVGEPRPGGIRPLIVWAQHAKTPET